MLLQLISVDLLRNYYIIKIPYVYVSYFRLFSELCF